jgi:hypothetical protein
MKIEFYVSLGLEMINLILLFLKITHCQNNPGYIKPTSNSPQMPSLTGKGKIGDFCDSNLQCMSGKCSVNFDRTDPTLAHAAVMGNCIDSTIRASTKPSISPFNPDNIKPTSNSPQMPSLTGKGKIGDFCDSNLQCMSGKCSVNFDRTDPTSAHAAVMGNCIDNRSRSFSKSRKTSLQRSERNLPLQMTGDI